MIAAFLLAAATAPQPAPEPPRAVVVAQARAEIVRAERVSAKTEAGAVVRTVRRGPQGAEIAFQ